MRRPPTPGGQPLSSATAPEQRGERGQLGEMPTSHRVAGAGRVAVALWAGRMSAVFNHSMVGGELYSPAGRGRVLIRAAAAAGAAAASALDALASPRLHLLPASQLLACCLPGFGRTSLECHS